MLFLYMVLFPLVSGQYFSPIVPSNAYQPYNAMPPVMYGQLRRSPPRVPQPYYADPISPVNVLPDPIEIGSDYAAYRQNAHLLQQQRPMSPQPFYPGGMGHNRVSPQFQHNFQEEIPIQVIHGRPEEREQPPQSVPSSSSSSLSLPRFLEGVGDEVVQQYKDIIRKPNSRYDEQVQELGKLVAKLDDQHQLLYHQFMSENDKIEDDHRQKVHKYVNEMSDPAQEQFAKISALLRNPELTTEESWGRVIALYDKLDPKLRDEFETRFKNFN
ncbi:unnamed protein product [Bursaphelenchus xylophilus]|uniref:(pine wood nematode) hypothetical protein n=1 Tax=Bursaphelenchus xylophilus TaxID=6326 RepID=A0A1I7SSH9_BURXY|nr:unnamed protein product [Bursaphelenchus xylophilus]CAG9097530.1 unnamed protein product [Bursaphelenchus xylophilus]